MVLQINRERREVKMEKLEKPIQVTKTFLPPINEYIEEIKKIRHTGFVTKN